MYFRNIQNDIQEKIRLNPLRINVDGDTFWGWIPFLDYSLDSIYSAQDIVATLDAVMKDGDIRVRIRDHKVSKSDSDDIFDGQISIQFEDFREFEYGEGTHLTGKVSMQADDSLNTITTEISILKNGLIRFKVISLKGKVFENLSDDSDIRIIVRELYFAIKKLFHRDLFNESEDLCNSKMQGADDILSIVRANDVTEAVDEIYKVFMKKLTLMQAIGLDTTKERIRTDKSLMGFRYFGESFVRSCVEDEDKAKRYIDALVLSYDASKSLRENRMNQDTNFMQDAIIRFTFPIWILSLLMTILAGSIFYGVTQGDSTWVIQIGSLSVQNFGLILVLLSALLVIAIGIIYAWIYYKNRQSL